MPLFPRDTGSANVVLTLLLWAVVALCALVLLPGHPPPIAAFAQQQALDAPEEQAAATASAPGERLEGPDLAAGGEDAEPAATTAPGGQVQGLVPAAAAASVRGALVTIYDEGQQDTIRHLPQWYSAMPWMRKPGRTWVCLYLKGALKETDLQKLRDMVPAWHVKFVPFRYDQSMQSRSASWEKIAVPPIGVYINWILTHDMYFGLPAAGGPIDFLAGFDYMMRFDDDVGFYEGAVVDLDIFEDMHARGVRVGWIQELEIAKKMRGLAEVEDYVQNAGSAFQVGAVWKYSTHRSFKMEGGKGCPIGGCLGRGYYAAGCVEMYNLDVFRNKHYRDFLVKVKAKQFSRNVANKILEQEYKTFWMQIYVPVHQWRSYACHFQVFHKELWSKKQHSLVKVDPEKYFFTHCDYKTHKRTGRGGCDADPAMRFC